MAIASSGNAGDVIVKKTSVTVFGGNDVVRMKGESIDLDRLDLDPRTEKRKYPDIQVERREDISRPPRLLFTLSADTRVRRVDAKASG